MNDRVKEILTTFSAYAQTFNLLEPAKVEPFFHLPAVLITAEQVAVMHNANEVIGVFDRLMTALKCKQFKESKILGSLQVTQLSDTQGMVKGIAKRFDIYDVEIEHFGFTYTLIKVEDKWKIIIGIIHDPETIFYEHKLS